MKLYTLALRGLLAFLVGGAVLAYVLLYWISADLAATYPALAHLQMPFFVVAVVAAIPGLVAVVALWIFSSLVARGEGFSPGTVRLLVVMRNSFAVMAGYLLIAFVFVTWAMAPGQSPGVFLGWCASEVVALLLFTFSAIMVRLFDNAATVRQDHELTV